VSCQKSTPKCPPHSAKRNSSNSYKRNSLPARPIPPFTPESAECKLPPHVPEELIFRFLKEDMRVVKKDLDSQIANQNEVIQGLREKQIIVERMVEDAQSQVNEIIGRR